MNIDDLILLQSLKELDTFCETNSHESVEALIKHVKLLTQYILEKKEDI